MLVVIWTALAAPTPWVGVKILTLVMKASIPLTEVAVLISLCWCNEWLRLMLTSDKLLGTMGLKVQGLLSGCQERTRPQLSELGYPHLDIKCQRACFLMKPEL